MKLPNHMIHRIAVEAGRDARTVRRFLQGKASGLASDAIAGAMRRLKIEMPTGSSSGSPSPVPEK